MSVGIVTALTMGAFACGAVLATVAWIISDFADELREARVDREVAELNERLRAARPTPTEEPGQ